MPAEIYAAVSLEIPRNVGVLVPTNDMCGSLVSMKKAKRVDRNRSVSEILLMMFRSAAREKTKLE